VSTINLCCHVQLTTIPFQCLFDRIHRISVVFLGRLLFLLAHFLPPYQLQLGRTAHHERGSPKRLFLILRVLIESHEREAPSVELELDALYAIEYS
jgi:hypothetical protein